MDSYVSNFNSNRHESVCKLVYFHNVFPQICVDSNTYSILVCGSAVVDSLYPSPMFWDFWPFQCVSCM